MVAACLLLACRRLDWNHACCAIQTQTKGEDRFWRRWTRRCCWTRWGCSRRARTCRSRATTSSASSRSTRPRTGASCSRAAATSSRSAPCATLPTTSACRKSAAGVSAPSLQIVCIRTPFVMNTSCHSHVKQQPHLGKTLRCVHHRCSWRRWRALGQRRACTCTASTRSQPSSAAATARASPSTACPPPSPPPCTPSAPTPPSSPTPLPSSASSLKAVCVVFPSALSHAFSNCNTKTKRNKTEKLRPEVAGDATLLGELFRALEAHATHRAIAADSVAVFTALASTRLWSEHFPHTFCLFFHSHTSKYRLLDTGAAPWR